MFADLGVYKPRQFGVHETANMRKVTTNTEAVYGINRASVFALLFTIYRRKKFKKISNILFDIIFFV